MLLDRNIEKQLLELTIVKNKPMYPKKNINKDLNSKRTFYFALGLLVLLFAFYCALEWKTEDNNNGYDIEVDSNKAIKHKDSTIIIETRAKN